MVANDATCFPVLCVDFVPLMDVAELILAEHGQDRFGDLRSVLLSLINAYHDEQNILASVKGLLNTDDYRVLIANYKTRSRSLPVGP